MGLGKNCRPQWLASPFSTAHVDHDEHECRIDHDDGNREDDDDDDDGGGGDDDGGGGDDDDGGGGDDDDDDGVAAAADDVDVGDDDGGGGGDDDGGGGGDDDGDGGGAGRVSFGALTDDLTLAILFVPIWKPCPTNMWPITCFVMGGPFPNCSGGAPPPHAHILRLCFKVSMTDRNKPSKPFWGAP